MADCPLCGCYTGDRMYTLPASARPQGRRPCVHGMLNCHPCRWIQGHSEQYWADGEGGNGE